MTAAGIVPMPTATNTLLGDTVPAFVGYDYVYVFIPVVAIIISYLLQYSYLIRSFD